MPRNGSGVYSPPSGTTATPQTTIESGKYNAFVADLVADANLARPIVAGGTGAATVAGARQELGVAAEVSSIAALKALVPVAGQTAYLTDAYREGTFTFRAGNYTARVALDTSNGVYVKADTISAATGAWVREGGELGLVRPQWFGPCGDGVWKLDATMTAGSPILTSATGTFTAADVGKMIKVGLAGGSGADLITTISAYTSATQVTLAANAVASVAPTSTYTHFVYGTDSYDAIVAARDFCTTATALTFPGKVLALGNCTYCHDGQLDFAADYFGVTAEGNNAWLVAFHAGVATSIDGYAHGGNAGVQMMTFGWDHDINIMGNSGTTNCFNYNSLFRCKIGVYARECAETAILGNTGGGTFGSGVLTDFRLSVSNAKSGAMSVVPQRTHDLTFSTDCKYYLMGEDCGDASTPMAAILRGMVRNQFWGSIEQNTHGGLHVDSASHSNVFTAMHNEFNHDGPELIVDGYNNLFDAFHGRKQDTTYPTEINGSRNEFRAPELDAVTIDAAATYNKFSRGKFHYPANVIDDNGSTVFEANDGVGDVGLAPSPVSPTFAGTFVDAGAPYKLPGYWRDAEGWVHLEGAINCGAAAPIGNTAFTLPAGYRPAGARSRVDLTFQNLSAGSAGQLSIDATGAVVIRSGANATQIISLAGVSFRRS